MRVAKVTVLRKRRENRRASCAEGSMASRGQNESRHHENVDVLDIEIPKYIVVLHNDDYTAFDFVVDLLIRVFRHTEEEAYEITRHIHFKGRGIAGVYPKEIAEMKVSDVHRIARGAGYPLRASIEPLKKS